MIDLIAVCKELQRRNITADIKFEDYGIRANYIGGSNYLFTLICDHSSDEVIRSLSNVDEIEERIRIEHEKSELAAKADLLRKAGYMVVAPREEGSEVSND